MGHGSYRGESSSARPFRAAARAVLRRRSPRMRTAALCALAAQPDHLDAELLRPHLSDANARVRAAALRAIRTAPAVWEPMLPHVGRRLADTSPDVCQAAADLAAEMGATGLVGSLVDGLADDVRRRWPSCFVGRTSALQRLTGVVFEPQPEWRTGEPLFDDRWWLARDEVAARWRELSAARR